MICVHGGIVSTESMSNADKKKIGSVKTATKILTCLRELNGATLTDVANTLDLHKSTTYVHLQTLLDERLVAKEDNIYHVSLFFLDYGTKVRSSRTIYDLVKPKMHRLAEETGERVQFMVEEHGRGIYVHRSRGEIGIKASSRVGVVRYLHSSAAGKAILSQLSNAAIENILDTWGLPEQTPNTITDPSELYDEIDRTRERGYAINKEEHIEGLWAIGAPIVSQNDTVLGALSISGPKKRIDNGKKRSELQDTLLAIINETELENRE